MRLSRIDFRLVIPVLVLLGIGLTTLFSVSGIYFRNQLIFFVLSIGVFLFFTSVDYDSLAFLAKPFYSISLIGLLFLLFIGFEARGAARWLDFFGLRLQFSEIFKPFLAISLGTFLANRPKSLQTFLLLTVLAAPLIFLIYKQPDLGSALMYVLSMLLTLMIVGFPLWWLLVGGLLLGALLPLLVHVLHGYQRTRLITFLHPASDPLGSSYNAIQALIAIGSGMLIGKGLGQGTQSGLRFLPERHTDFIFATLSEDLGFVGAVVVVLSFGFLLYRLYQIARATDEMSERIFIIATFSLFLVQCFVNIGMNSGLLPIVGVPLPFVSYGGSSLLASSIFLGIASGIGCKAEKRVTLEIR